jgi:predicted NBD/HSP70 family sugar kinase
VNLDKLFRRSLSYLSNDANVAAYGEKKWGARPEGWILTLLLSLLGTGIGTGIFVQNEILILEPMVWPEKVVTYHY